MAKTKYEVLCNEIAAKVKETNSSRHSKGDFVDMAQALLNSPEYVVEYKLKDGTKGQPMSVKSEPVKKYRESLEPVLKSFGIDSSEMGKLQDVQFSKKHAEAVTELASLLVKDLTGTGRKLILPITQMDETQMEISQVKVPKKTAATTKIVKDEKTGDYSTVPTGKEVTTAAHSAVKASNKVPAWLKTEKLI